MIGCASVKMVGDVDAEVSERFRPVKVFAGGLVTSAAGTGASADPENGRIVLAPGVYLLAVSMNVVFAHTHAPAVTLALVLGGDPRFKGPRQVASRMSGGNISVWGIVTVPTGPPATCEVWAQADDEYPTQVTFSRGELLAVLMSKIPEGNS